VLTSRSLASRPATPAALAETLAAGPFHVALRAAISASGLALDRIRYRLRLRDVSISVPTLSNWQSGRRRPERPESLRALAELEDVLDLPPAALRSLLGPPRPRGRAARPAGPNGLAEAWGGAVTALLAGVDTSSDGRLVRLSQHDMIAVDGNGRPSLVATRQVLRAAKDGADRWILVWEIGTGTRLPEIIAGQHCRLHRLNADRDAGLMLGELVFDAPLHRGETIIMEYQVVYPSTPLKLPSDRFIRRFHLPTRDYVLEARFDPASPPARCIRTGSPGLLVPGQAGSVHLVEFNVTGSIGIHWDM
jgi:hypothetical protein